MLDGIGGKGRNNLGEIILSFSVQSPVEAKESNQAELLLICEELIVEKVSQE